MFVDHIAPNRLAKLRSDRTAGKPGSTSWPSDSSSAAAARHRRGALVVHRRPVRVVVEQADAQPAGIGAELVDVRAQPAGERSPCRRRPARGRGRAGGPCRARERLTHSSTLRFDSSRTGPSVIRPWVGFSPTSPQHDAGMRIEPPPSLAWAIGTSPAATAAADPPLEPPGVRVRSHGLCVGPQASGSVVGSEPSSGLFVRPAVTNPAALNRWTRVVSISDTGSVAASGAQPLLIGCPA